MAHILYFFTVHHHHIITIVTQHCVVNWYMKSFTQFMPLSVDKLFKFSSSLRLIDINDGGRPSKELARAVIFFLLYIFDWEYTFWHLQILWRHQQA